MREDDEPNDPTAAPGIEQALAGGVEALAAYAAAVHPADLAEALHDVADEERPRVLAALDVARGAELLLHADDAVRAALIPRLAPERVARYVESLPADQAVDLLAHVDAAAVEAVLRALPPERARELRELAGYGPDTAGGIMSTEFLAVPLGTRLGDAIKEIKGDERAAAQEEVGVFVVDADGRPVGYLSDRELLTKGIHTAVDQAMRTDLVVAGLDDDQEEVARQVLKYDVDAVPVVDAAGVLVGVIHAEDVGDVIEEEAEEDFRRLVGTSPEDQTRLPIARRVASRLPLMGLTVLGGVVTARILDLALPPGGGTVAVLRYLPIIIGLAGNVGIQSSTILVRAFATGEVQPAREPAVVRAEVAVGFCIGAVCGLITLYCAGLLERDFALGRAVGCAIVAAVTWASALGCTVPILCRRIGIDPAVVAGPFLITLSDVSGAAIFVGVAHVLLEIGSPGA